MLELVRRFRDESNDGHVLGPIRAVLGILLGWHALLAIEQLTNVGYFGDGFHLAMLPEVFVPPARIYTLALALRVCLSAMVALGIWARPALLASALMGFWLLLCDRNEFHHDQYSLFCFALLLSFAPCDRSWRASEASVPEPRRGPWWGVRLAQVQVSLVYLASGGAKLLDPDWRDGLVLGDRLARFGQIAVARGVPRSLVDFVGRADIVSGAAKVAIMTELFLCIALWFRPARVIAFWWGLWFHVFVLLGSNLESFSVLAIALYGLFVTPDYRARVLRFDPSRFWGKLAALVPFFDWFARFRVEPWEPDDQRGHSIVVVRRDGDPATGIRALAMMTRCLPVLFPLWGPVALLASFTRRGDSTTRG